MSVTRNRKAYHDYEILEQYEAGVVLHGTEVKSIRAGHVNLKEAHVRVMNGEVFLINSHISPYNQGNINNHVPNRSRKLLLNKRQIDYLAGKVQEQGLTIVPLSVFIKGRHIKISIGLARGKKLHDKRRSMKERDMQREMQRALKRSE